MKNINDYSKRIMITGGAGFIGSHVVRHFVNKYPDYLIVNFDALTYCGNLENLKDIQDKENYAFFEGDIRNVKEIELAFENYRIDGVIHMAAESHVDRSMTNPNIFMETNINGTVNLLNTAKEYWKEDMENHSFFNMASDEIMGSLGPNDPPFNENTPLDPHSPYSTSKTCQYLYGKTYYEAYGVPVVSLACGNAIGPNQFPEKLVPLTIDRLINKQEIPIYGQGLQCRDWTAVSDIVKAIDLLFNKGKVGELYCIGGDACTSNIEIVHALINEYAGQTGEKAEDLEKLITFVMDKRGKSHDFRYDLSHDKITNELGWKPKYSFNDSIKETVEWYLNNQEWIEHCKTGEYRNWISTYYGEK